MNGSLIAVAVIVGMASTGIFQNIGAINRTTLEFKNVGVTAICNRMPDDENITGSTEHEVNLTGKRMVVFKKILNGKRRFLVFYSPSSLDSSIIAARSEADAVGVELVERSVESLAELKTVLTSIKREEVDGILQIPDAWMNQHMELILQVASRKKIPTMTLGRGHITKGALASYWSESYRCELRAGAPTNRLLVTAAQQDLPAKRIKRFYLAINLKTAHEIGFTFSPKVLRRADLVVD